MLGLTYMMLSKAIEMRHLFITRGLRGSPNDFCPFIFEMPKHSNLPFSHQCGYPLVKYIIKMVNSKLKNSKSFGKLQSIKGQHN
jgi:hypothetical protein